MKVIYILSSPLKQAMSLNTAYKDVLSAVGSYQSK